VRFASVYRQFRSVSDFVATLEGLGSGTRAGSIADARGAGVPDEVSEPLAVVA
jgi:hypothetical protein